MPLTPVTGKCGMGSKESAQVKLTASHGESVENATARPALCSEAGQTVPRRCGVGLAHTPPAERQRLPQRHVGGSDWG